LSKLGLADDTRRKKLEGLEAKDGSNNATNATRINRNPNMSPLIRDPRSSTKAPARISQVKTSYSRINHCQT
jgi:hypothetical protein